MNNYKSISKYSSINNIKYNIYSKQNNFHKQKKYNKSKSNEANLFSKTFNDILNEIIKLNI